MSGKKSQQVVLRLFDAIMNNDRERILSFFTNESVFQCPSQSPAVGHAAIWSALSSTASQAEQAECRVCAVAERPDGRVQAERVQRYLVDGVWCEHKVTGVLAVNGCKITQWSDSYDGQQDQARSSL
jgi:limonene-1,2-epoxide hydrolase